MQGFILNINRAKDEDIIVNVLTQNKIQTLYRFYGARHSIVALGHKIDYEAKETNRPEFKMLKGVIHLSNSWMRDREKLYVWQSFVKLMFKHLKDVEEIDVFYYDLIEKSEQLFEKQNCKRVVVEAYIKILKHEGRLHDEFNCFICDVHIDNDLSLTRSLLPAHKSCVFSKTFDILKIKQLYDSNSTLFLDDQEVDDLWSIINEGF